MKTGLLLLGVLGVGGLTGCTAPVLGFPGNIRTFRGNLLQPNAVRATWTNESVDQGRFLNVRYGAALHRAPFESGVLEVVDAATVEVEIGSIEQAVSGGASCYCEYIPGSRRVREAVGAGWFDGSLSVQSTRNIDQPTELGFLPQTMERGEPIRVEVPLGPERVTLFFTVAITNGGELRSIPTADGFTQSNRSISRMRLGVDLVTGGGRFIERFMAGPDVVTSSDQEFDYTRRILTTRGFANHVAEARIRLADEAGTNRTTVAEYQDLDTDSWRLAPREISLR